MLIDLVVTTLFVFVYFSNILKNRSHLFTVLQALTRFPEQKSLQKQLEEMKVFRLFEYKNDHTDYTMKNKSDSTES